MCLEVLKPPPDRLTSEWADQERILPPGSPEPGPWRSIRIAYMIPVMNAFDDRRYSMIVCSCGSQMGKSEVMLNIFGKRFDDGPRVPAIMVQPNEKLTRSFSNDRVGRMLETAKGLQAKLDKGQKDKVTEKFILGIRWGFAWAGSATELASHPCGLAIADEVDRMQSNTKGEGDPVVLIGARLKNYYNSKLGAFSTPTVWPGSKITILFYSGTMGMWSWVCPHCHDHFVPQSKYLKWPSKAKVAQIESEAHVECPHCKGKINDAHKAIINKDGRYEYHEILDPDAEEYELNPIGPVPAENRTASFWISGLCSPWQTFGEIAVQLATAYRSGDQETIKAALNTYCGECYKIKGVGHKWDTLRDLIGEYEPGTLPEGVQLITLGADVHDLSIYYVIRGWGFNQESWKLESGIIPGETEFPAVWNLFSKILDRDFDGMKIKRAFVDSGYNTNQVYLFCRRFPGITFPAKGQESLARPLTMAKVDLSIGGKIKKGGVRLYHVDTSYFKTWLYARYKWPIGESGSFHLDSETSDDYLKQISAEQFIIYDTGKTAWEQIRSDNHYGDCEVYAAGAATSLQVHALKEKSEKTEIKKKVSAKRKPFVNAGVGFIRS